MRFALFIQFQPVLHAKGVRFLKLINPGNRIKIDLDAKKKSDVTRKTK
jgi:hypothetical protein